MEYTVSATDLANIQLNEEDRVKEILPNDKDTVKGAKEYRITFAEPLDAEITDKEGFGIENLS